MLELFPGEQECAQQTPQVLFNGVGAGGDGVFPHGFVRVNGVVFLGEIADFQPVPGHDAARPIGVLLPRQESQQGGFSGAVKAQHDHAGLLIDG